MWNQNQNGVEFETNVKLLFCLHKKIKFQIEYFKSLIALLSPLRL